MNQKRVDYDMLRLFLNKFRHPYLIENWAFVEHIVKLTGNKVEIILPFAAISVLDELEKWVESNKSKSNLDCAFDYKIKIARLAVDAGKKHLAGIKNIIVVSSAKGGVGKSTIAANLALALQKQGASVGLLDADLYGPSIPRLLNTLDCELVVDSDEKMLPIKKYDIVTNSIGYLIDQDKPVIWRGPMASKVLEQLLVDTKWGDLDYLVIDMPPGTGDIQISMAQKVPITGIVAITTPQDLALADVIKGINMFKKIGGHIVGIIENMSYFVCEKCGNKTDIFGQGKTVSVAKEQQLSILANLPLDISIRKDCDLGIPTVLAETSHSKTFLELAAKLASDLYWGSDVVPDEIQIKLL